MESYGPHRAENIPDGIVSGATESEVGMASPSFGVNEIPGERADFR